MSVRLRELTSDSIVLLRKCLVCTTVARGEKIIARLSRAQKQLTSEVDCRMIMARANGPQGQKCQYQHDGAAAIWSLWWDTGNIKIRIPPMVRPPPKMRW